MADYALCPFYEYEKNGILHCESKIIEFPSHPERKSWLKFHCHSWDFKICKFYSQLIKKYDSMD